MKKASYRKAAEEPAAAYWARWREEACAGFGSPRKPPAPARPSANRPATAAKPFPTATLRRRAAIEDAHAAA